MSPEHQHKKAIQPDPKTPPQQKIGLETTGKRVHADILLRFQQHQASAEDIRHLQSVVGNHQVQRLLSTSPQPIQRGISDIIDTGVAIFNAAIEATTAYKLWVGDGKSDWTKATDIEKKPYFDRAKLHLETIKKTKETDGFKALKADEQTKLLNLIQGTNRELSVPANVKLRTLLDGPAKDFNATKAKSFRKFMADQGWLPGVVAPVAGTFAGKEAPYKITGPDEVKAYKFRSKTVDAHKYEIEIGKKKVPVYFPKAPDAAAGLFHTVDEVAKGLAILPETELSVVTQVNAEPGQNPDDAHWAKAYKDPNFRSYMTAGASGVISIYPSKSGQSQEYLQGTMIHETGHTLSRQKWGANAEKDAGWKPWRKAMKKDGYSASKYAQASIDEDFAETLQLYEQVRGKPQEAEIENMMPERIKLIRALLAGK